MDVDRLAYVIENSCLDFSERIYLQKDQARYIANAVIKELLRTTPQSPATAQGVPLSREECTKFVKIEAKRHDDGFIGCSVTGMLSIPDVYAALGYANTTPQPASEQVAALDGVLEMLRMIDKNNPNYKSAWPIDECEKFVDLLERFDAARTALSQPASEQRQTVGADGMPCVLCSQCKCAIKDETG